MVIKITLIFLYFSSGALSYEQIVSFKSNDNLSEFTRALSHTTSKGPAEVKKRYNFGDVHAVLVDFREYQSASTLISAYDTTKDVTVSNNSLIYAHEEEQITPCVTQNTGSVYWGLTRTSYKENPNYNATGVGYEYNSTGKGIDIFIVDSGVFLQHTTFQGRASHGFTAGDLRTTEGDSDRNGHGTFVAGLAAGSIHGTAKEANIISVKVLGEDGSGTLGYLLEGFEWIHQNAKQRKAVINLSLGFKGMSTDIQNAIHSLVNDIGPVIVAAGNSNEDACLYTPASHEDAITVGSTDMEDKLADFTNHGTCVDILAPGVNIASAYALAANLEAIANGTSLSCPLVAGVAALIVENNPNYAYSSDIKDILLERSTKGLIDPPLYESPNALLYSACIDWSSGTCEHGKMHILFIALCFIYFNVWSI